MPISRFASLAAALLAASSIHAATFTVTNTLDTGAGSLRAAIVAANANPGADTIAFNLPGAGVQTIAPATALPDITGPVTIDGWSQPGFTGTPLIEISGAAIATPFTHGLHLVAGSDSSTIRGLIVNRFRGFGFFVESSHGDHLFGNWSGLAADGTSAGNGEGLALMNANQAVIGGTGTNERNVISGNPTIQISLTGANGTAIKGNYIGTDPTGLADRSNSTGVGIFGSDDTIVGGTGPGERNVISAGLSGLYITAGAKGNQITGNIFGFGADGTTVLSNDANISVSAPADVLNSITNNVIANATGGAGGDGYGVAVYGTGTRVLISQNSFRNNAKLAIDLRGDGVTPNDPGDADTGENDLQNFPVLTSASSAGGNVTIAGTLNSIASSIFTLEFYANILCDPSGFGEGETYLGSAPVTTNASGNATFNVTFAGPANGFITATARDASNRASEFSACAAIASGPVIGTVQLTNSTYSVAEGAGTGSFSISRTGGSGAASVQYTLANGTATNGADYTKVPATGTVFWAAGDTSTKNISFDVTDDALAESTETFTITLSAPANVGLGTPSSATESIIDDDFPPGGKLAFTASTASIGERDGVVTLDITRTGGSTGEVRVTAYTANGSATAGSDYTATTQTLVWEAGDTAPRQIVVPITDDLLIEGTETFTVRLLDAVGATIGVPDTVTVTIVDDDHAGTLVFSSATYSTTEAAGTVMITVNRTGGSTGPATIDYSTAPGTATAADFTPVSGTLTWMNGDDAPKSFFVQITSDGTAEPAESFTVNLTNATGGALGTPSSATVTIAASNAAVPMSSPLTLLLLAIALAGAAFVILRE